MASLRYRNSRTSELSLQYRAKSNSYMCDMLSWNLQVPLPYNVQGSKTQPYDVHDEDRCPGMHVAVCTACGQLLLASCKGVQQDMHVLLYSKRHCSSQLTVV